MSDTNHTMFLDVNKAFDYVSLIGMLEKLKELLPRLMYSHTGYLSLTELQLYIPIYVYNYVT